MDIEKEFVIPKEYIAYKNFNNKYILNIESHEDEDNKSFNNRTKVIISVWTYKEQSNYSYNRGNLISEEEAINMGLPYNKSSTFVDINLVSTFVKILNANTGSPTINRGSICAKCKRFDEYASPSNKHNNEVRCYLCY